MSEENNAGTVEIVVETKVKTTQIDTAIDKVGKLNTEVQKLGDKPVDIKTGNTDSSLAKLETFLDNINNMVNKLNNQTATPKVEISGLDGLESQLKNLSQKIEAFGGDYAKTILESEKRITAQADVENKIRLENIRATNTLAKIEAEKQSALEIALAKQTAKEVAAVKSSAKSNDVDALDYEKKLIDIKRLTNQQITAMKEADRAISAESKTASSQRAATYKAEIDIVANQLEQSNKTKLAQYRAYTAEQLALATFSIKELNIKDVEATREKIAQEKELTKRIVAEVKDRIALVSEANKATVKVGITDYKRQLDLENAAVKAGLTELVNVYRTSASDIKQKVLLSQNELIDELKSKQQSLVSAFTVNLAKGITIDKDTVLAQYQSLNDAIKQIAKSTNDFIIEDEKRAHAKKLADMKAQPNSPMIAGMSISATQTTRPDINQQIRDAKAISDQINVITAASHSEELANYRNLLNLRNAADRRGLDEKVAMYQVDADRIKNIQVAAIRDVIAAIDTQIAKYRELANTTSNDRALNQINAEIRALERRNEVSRSQLAGYTIAENRANTGSQIAGFGGNNASVVNELTNSINKLQQALMLVGVTLSAHQVMDYADQWLHFTNSVDISTEKTGRAAEMQARLFKLAQDNRAPLESITNVYMRMSRAAESLNLSQNDTVKMIDTVTKSLAIMGTAPNMVRGGLLQLEQALGGVVVRGQEFKSILDSQPLLMQSIANHYKEAARDLKVQQLELQGASKAQIENAKAMDISKMSIAELRTTMLDGQMRADATSRAIIMSQDEMIRKYSLAHKTFAQGFTELDNAMIRYVGTFNSTTAASETFFKVMTGIGDHLDVFVSGISGLAAAMLTLAINSERAKAAMAFLATGASLPAVAIGAVAATGAYAFGQNQETAAKNESATSDMAKIRNKQSELLEKLNSYDKAISTSNVRTVRGMDVSVNPMSPNEAAKRFLNGLTREAVEKELLDIGTALEASKARGGKTEEYHLAEETKRRAMESAKTQSIRFDDAFNQSLGKSKTALDEASEATIFNNKVLEERNKILDGLVKSTTAAGKSILTTEEKTMLGSVGTPEYYEKIKELKGGEYEKQAQEQAIANVRQAEINDVRKKAEADKKAWLEQLPAKQIEVADRLKVDEEQLNKINKQIEQHYSDKPIKVKLQANQEQFIKEFSPLAEKLSKVTGVDSATLLAQAGLESGWGSSRFAREGKNFFNLSKGDWKGKTVGDFRSYDTQEEGWMDYANFLKFSRYKEAVANKNDPEKYLTGLKKGGFDATSDSYVKDVMNVRNKIAGIVQQVPSELLEKQAKLEREIQTSRQLTNEFLKTGSKELYEQITHQERVVKLAEKEYSTVKEVAAEKERNAKAEIERVIAQTKAGYDYAHAFDAMKERQDKAMDVQKLGKELGGFAIPQIDAMIKQGLAERDALTNTKAELVTTLSGLKESFVRTQDVNILKEIEQVSTKILNIDDDIANKNREINNSLSQQTKLRQDANSVIQDLKNGNDELLASLTNTTAELEKQRLIKQKGATGEQVKEISDLVDTRENLKSLVSVKSMVTESITSGFSTMFSDVLTRGKSFTDAFRDMFKNMIARISDGLMNLAMNALMSGNFIVAGLAAAGSIVTSLLGGLFKDKVSDNTTMSSKDTGSVLGKPNEVSNSINNVIKALNDIHSEEYPELKATADTMRALGGSINNVVTKLAISSNSFTDMSKIGTFVRPGQPGAVSPNGSTGMMAAGIGASTIAGATGLTAGAMMSGGVALSSMGMGTAGAALTGAGMSSAGAAFATGSALGATGGMASIVGGAVIGLAGGLILAGLQYGLGKLLGIGKTKITQIGEGMVVGFGDFFGEGMETAMDAKSWSKWEMKTKGWFSDTKKIVETYGKLSDEMNGALKDVFVGLRDAINVNVKDLGLGDLLGGKMDVLSRTMPTLRMDWKEAQLKNKDLDIGQYIANQLTGYSDRIAQAVFGNLLGRFQKMGEGMLETVNRLRIGMAVAFGGLEKLGISVRELFKDSPMGAIEFSDAMVELWDSTGTAKDGVKNLAAALNGFYEVTMTVSEKTTTSFKSANELIEQFKTTNASQAGFLKGVDASNITGEQWRQMLNVETTALADASNALGEVSKYADAVKTYANPASSTGTDIGQEVGKWLSSHPGDWTRVTGTSDYAKASWDTVNATGIGETQFRMYAAIPGHAMGQVAKLFDAMREQKAAAKEAGGDKYTPEQLDAAIKEKKALEDTVAARQKNVIAMQDEIKAIAEWARIASDLQETMWKQVSTSDELLKREEAKIKSGTVYDTVSKTTLDADTLAKYKKQNQIMLEHGDDSLSLFMKANDGLKLQSDLIDRVNTILDKLKGKDTEVIDISNLMTQRDALNSALTAVNTTSKAIVGTTENLDELTSTTTSVRQVSGLGLKELPDILKPGGEGWFSVERNGYAMQPMAHGLPVGQSFVDVSKIKDGTPFTDVFPDMFPEARRGRWSAAFSDALFSMGNTNVNQRMGTNPLSNDVGNYTFFGNKDYDSLTSALNTLTNPTKAQQFRDLVKANAMVDIDAIFARKGYDPKVYSDTPESKEAYFNTVVLPNIEKTFGEYVALAFNSQKMSKVGAPTGEQIIESSRDKQATFKATGSYNPLLGNGVGGATVIDAEATKAEVAKLDIQIADKLKGLGISEEDFKLATTLNIQQLTKDVIPNLSAEAQTALGTLLGDVVGGDKWRAMLSGTVQDVSSFTNAELAIMNSKITNFIKEQVAKSKFELDKATVITTENGMDRLTRSAEKKWLQLQNATDKVINPTLSDVEIARMNEVYDVQAEGAFITKKQSLELERFNATATDAQKRMKAFQETLKGIDDTFDDGTVQGKTYADELKKLAIAAQGLNALRDAQNVLKDFVKSVAQWQLDLNLTKKGTTQTQAEIAQANFELRTGIAKATEDKPFVLDTTKFSDAAQAGIRDLLSGEKLTSRDETFMETQSRNLNSLIPAYTSLDTAVRNYYGYTPQAEKLIADAESTVVDLSKNIDPEKNILGELTAINLGILNLPDSIDKAAITIVEGMRDSLLMLDPNSQDSKDLANSILSVTRGETNSIDLIQSRTIVPTKSANDESMIQAQNEELKKQNFILLKQNEILQEGFTQLIVINKSQNDNLDGIQSTVRRTANT